MFMLNVTALAIRLLGIYVLFKASFNQSGVDRLQAQMGEIGSEAPEFLSAGTIAMLLIAAAFIFFPVTIARMLVPKTSLQSPSLADGSEAMELCAYTVMGVFIFSTALPNLVEYLTYIAAFSQQGDMFDQAFVERTYISLGATVFQVAIGTYLALGAPSVAKVVRRLRG